MNKYNRRDFIKTGSLLTGGLLLGDSLFGGIQSGSEPFLGSIKIVSFNFAPKDWALCNGALLPINQNQALFSLLGTTYGGNGQTTFALPDFRGRVPIHSGYSYYTMGERGGEQAHTLSINELPQHIHQINRNNLPGISINISNQMDESSPENNVFGMNTKFSDRFHSQYDDHMGSADPYLTNNTGGSQAHLNMMPFLTLNFIIALQGIFPSQT